MLFESVPVALLHVLAVHARVFTLWPVHQTWEQLTGLPLDPTLNLALVPHEGEVPLLLRDPIALLIQFILLLPLHIDQSTWSIKVVTYLKINLLKLSFVTAYFSAVVKVLYNLLYYQIIVQISCGLTQAERNAVIGRSMLDDQSTAPTSEAILRTVITHFRGSALYCNDDNAGSSSSHGRIRSHVIEQQVRNHHLKIVDARIIH